jgi:DNA-binding transcriptional LysR family regulator
MTLDEIEAFVAVAEAGSVNRAARRLRLSQPAVTRRLQRFESEMGTALFDRRSRPRTLTHAGRVALEQCRQVLRGAEALKAGSGPREVIHGECRVGIAHGLLDVVLAGPIDHLRAAYPRLKLRISSGWSPALLEQVREEALHLALIHRPDTDRLPGGLAGRLIARERLVFVAPRRGRLRAVVGPRDLADATWVLGPEAYAIRAALQQMLAGIQSPLRIAVEAAGSELQLSLVALGTGLGLVPERWLLRSSVRGQLRTLRVEGHRFRLGVWTVRGSDQQALAQVLDTFDEELAHAFRRRGAP